MTQESTGPQESAGPREPAGPQGPAGIRQRTGEDRLTGIALMLGGGLSNQTGAAVAALAFPVLGPAGVVAVRQWVAGVLLLATGRPRLREFTARQWWPVLGMAVVFGTMNLSLYTAISRVGLGLAVTLEFLGPLVVALAGSRRKLNLGCALVAAVAVVVLVRPQPSTDHVGMALALLAGACWAGHILLSRTVGRRIPGVRGAAASAGVSGLLYVPVGAVVLWQHPPTLAAAGCAVVAGVLSSVVPFLADLLALRRVPAQLFGMFMSVNPVLAALLGVVVLGQLPGWPEWAAIAAIVVANSIAARAHNQVSSQRSGRSGDGPAAAR